MLSISSYHKKEQKKKKNMRKSRVKTPRKEKMMKKLHNQGKIVKSQIFEKSRHRCILL